MTIRREGLFRRALITAVTAALVGSTALTLPTAAAAAEPELPMIVDTTSAAGFVHPGIGFTGGDMRNMREQVLAGVEPWASYYTAMTATKYAARDYRAENSVGGTDTPKNAAYDNASMRSTALRDGIGAMTQALQYVVTGDLQYRANSMHVLRAWSGLEKDKYAYFADAHIHTGVPLYYMLIAAEILRTTEPAEPSLAGYALEWSGSDEDKLEANLIRPILETFLFSKNRLWNQHLYGVIGMIAAAIYLDDAALYAERVEWFTVNAGYTSEHDMYGGNVNGALAEIFREIPADAPGNTTGGPFIQHMEMLRDQAHGQGDVDLLVALARIVDKQGSELDPVTGQLSTAADAVSAYGFLDNRILRGADVFTAFMMGQEIPYVPASEGGTISQAYRGRLQDPLSEAYLQYQYAEGIDVSAIAPHVAELYERRDGPLYYYGTGVQNFWSDRGSDYTGAEYWVAFPEELAGKPDTVAPLAPSAELSVGKFGQPLGAGAQAHTDTDGTAFIQLRAEDGDAALAVRRAIWGDRSKESLVGITVRSVGSTQLAISRTADEAPFAEVTVPDTNGEWTSVWFDLALEKTPSSIGDNIVFLRAEPGSGITDVAGVLAQANGVLTPPRFVGQAPVALIGVVGEPLEHETQVTGTGTLAVQEAPEGSALTANTFRWTPDTVGTEELLLTLGDAKSVTARTVTIDVVADRADAIEAVDKRAGDTSRFTSAGRAALESSLTALREAETGSATSFGTALAASVALLPTLEVRSPELADGTLDYRTLVAAAPLGTAQLSALVDGDNQTHWGDQRVNNITFDFGTGFRVKLDRVGLQARDTFANRAQGTNVYGSNDRVAWTLLTAAPNRGQDASLEWLDVVDAQRANAFRFVRFQIDAPGVPSDPAYPGIWSIADIRLDGIRVEAVGSMSEVTIASPDAVAGRVVAGDRVTLTLRGPANNSDVAVSVWGTPATVTSPRAGEWTASLVLPQAPKRGAAVTFAVDYVAAGGVRADTIYATTDGSALVASTNEGRIDAAFSTATVLRPDGVVDNAWTQYTAKMFDGNAASHSDTRLNSGLYGNVWDFGADTVVSLTGAELLVRQDGYGTSRIADMRLEGSNDMQTWTRLTPQSPAKTLSWQQWSVTNSSSFRYVRLVNGQILNVAELVLFGEAGNLWAQAATYAMGDRVSYEGKTYVAQWWTRAETPGKTTTGSWMEQGAPVAGTRSWTPSWVYTSGDTVAYDGHTYRAKWWTRNAQPGVANGPWEKTGTY